MQCPRTSPLSRTLWRLLGSLRIKLCGVRRREVRTSALKSLLDSSGTTIVGNGRRCPPVRESWVQTPRTETRPSEQQRCKAEAPCGNRKAPHPKTLGPDSAHLAGTKASRAGRLPEHAGPTHLTPRPLSQTPLAPSGPQLRVTEKFTGLWPGVGEGP